MELLLGDFFQRDEFVNPGVIDHDVDLPERFLCFSEESLDFCLLRDVALNRDSFSSSLANFFHHAICVLLCRRVIDHHRRACLREFFRDARADSFRRSRYYCNFPFSFSFFILVLSISFDPFFPFTPSHALSSSARVTRPAMRGGTCRCHSKPLIRSAEFVKLINQFLWRVASKRNQVRRSVSSIHTSMKLAVATSHVRHTRCEHQVQIQLDQELRQSLHWHAGLARSPIRRQDRPGTTRHLRCLPPGLIVPEEEAF